MMPHVLSLLIIIVSLFLITVTNLYLREHTLILFLLYSVVALIRYISDTQRLPEQKKGAVGWQITLLTCVWKLYYLFICKIMIINWVGGGNEINVIV